jgi:hypothetical protein
MFFLKKKPFTKYQYYTPIIIILLPIYIDLEISITLIL